MKSLAGTKPQWGAGKVWHSAKAAPVLGLWQCLLYMFVIFCSQSYVFCEHATYSFWVHLFLYALYILMVSALLGIFSLLVHKMCLHHPFTQVPAHHREIIDSLPYFLWGTEGTVILTTLLYRRLWNCVNGRAEGLCFFCTQIWYTAFCPCLMKLTLGNNSSWAFISQDCTQFFDHCRKQGEGPFPAVHFTIFLFLHLPFFLHSLKIWRSFFLTATNSSQAVQP